MYRVVICYSGAIYFDVEASNEEEAKMIAQRDFDETDDRELVANLIDICIDEVAELDTEEKLIVYRVGFNGNDETEVDAECEDEAVELAKTIATESGLEFNLDYVESCGYVENYVED